MKPSEFEQLVSEWLDRPQKADLRARVIRALRRDRRLMRVLRKWVRLHKLLRRAAVVPHAAAWGGLKARVADRLERPANEAR